MSIAEKDATMAELSPPPADRTGRALAIGVVVVCLIVAAFLAGRRTSSPPGSGSPTTTAESHEGHDHGTGAGQHAAGGATGHGEDGHTQAAEGVVKFTPSALAKAGIRVQPVSDTGVRAYLQVTGAVEPNLAGVVKVTPRVAGKITSLRATVGDPVRAGQVLATMTSTELAAAQAQYRQAVARVAAAQANLRRQRQLAGFGEFGQHKVQEARGTFNAAQGDVHEAQAEINAARNEVAEAEAALAAAQSDEASAHSDVISAETMVGQSETQVGVAESRFNRQEALLKEQLTSRQDWEQARADFQKAQSDVRAAKAALGSASARVQATHAKARQAQAVIETHRARLQQSEAKLAAAQHRLALARAALAREEKVFSSGILASKEVADAEALLRHAEIERAGAADAVRLLGGTPGGSNTLAVSAPLGGRITERTVTAGETVTSDKPLFTVVNLHTVWVQLNVYQRDLSAIRVGLPVTVRTDAVPGKQFQGTVAYIGDAVDETTRTVKVRCVIPNPGGRLKPDMFVRGGIATGARARGLAVPREAVQTLEGKAVVFVQGDAEGEFTIQAVQPGETVGTQTIIASGLQEGDIIVTQGAFMVKAEAMKAELGHSHAH